MSNIPAKVGSELRQQMKQRAVVQIKIQPNNSETEIPENLIERDLQLLLKPFNSMQAVFVASKYKIRNGIITTNSISYDIVSLVASLVMIIAFTYLKLTKLYSYLSIFHIVTLSVGFLTNCYNNFTEKRNNVLLIIKIQSICRSLKVDASFFRRFIVPNWMCVFGVIISFAALIGHMTYLFSFSEFFCALFIFFYALFDSNLLYAAIIMRLLGTCLKRWLEDVQKLGYCEECVHDHVWDKMFKVYLDIVEVYQLIESTLGPHVSIIISHLIT